MLDTRSSTSLRFTKMHGLGNDFVVVDARRGAAPEPSLVAALADRHRGVGFDQLAVITEGPRLTFYNSDGSPSNACGNATRCVAALEMERTGADRLALSTGRGTLEAVMTADGVSVNMGQPMTSWREIPLAWEVDTLSLPIAGDPVATSMGNPHCTFFVEDAEAVDLESFGPAHENHPLFPERVNVQVARVIDENRVRVRVWERGAGITLASGSSSCAVAVAAARRGLTGRGVEVILDGGSLRVDWRDDGVWMTGPTARVFEGVLAPGFPEAA